MTSSLFRGRIVENDCFFGKQTPPEEKKSKGSMGKDQKEGKWPGTGIDGAAADRGVDQPDDSRGQRRARLLRNLSGSEPQPPSTCSTRAQHGPAAGRATHRARRSAWLQTLLGGTLLWGVAVALEGHRQPLDQQPRQLRSHLQDHDNRTINDHDNYGAPYTCDEPARTPPPSPPR